MSSYIGGSEEHHPKVRAIQFPRYPQTKSPFISLVKVDDDRLQALLEEIQTMRKFQS